VRILLACPYSWDAPGGVQVHVAQLGAQLSKRGHQVLVLAPGERAPREPWVHLVGKASNVRYQGTVAPICFRPGSFARVRREMRSFRPDLVHAHEPLTPSTGMFAVLAAKKAPVVATFHAYAERSRLYSVAAPLLRRVWRRLRIRIAVSQAAAGFVEERFGPGIRIVPNGCDVDLFAHADPAEGLPAGRRFLWVGRLDPQKGFPVAVEAFGLLAEDLPDLWFVVVGEGQELAALSRLSRPARQRVKLVGRVAHERLPGYYKGADVYASPALGQESFGLVLVEAMASGVPVVASDIPGYREVVRDGVDGTLVAPGDPRALAAAVRPMLTDPAVARTFSEAGRARAETFRWERVVDQLERAYREVTGRVGG
jgi:phosphatidyl-myo-inositol alpha-mannosyltransferase